MTNKELEELVSALNESISALQVAHNSLAERVAALESNSVAAAPISALTSNEALLPFGLAVEHIATKVGVDLSQVIPPLVEAKLKEMRDNA